MLAQPRACALVVGIRRSHELPISARVVHAAKVHQLVKHHVVADLGRHQHEAPVQTDVAVVPAGTPPRALIANADPRDGKPLISSQLQQTLPELQRGAVAHRHRVAGGHTRRLQSGTLVRDPPEMAEAELRGLPPRAAAWNRDAHTAVTVDAQDIAPRAAMPHEVELDRGRVVLEREPELHDDRIP